MNTSTQAHVKQQAPSPVLIGDMLKQEAEMAAKKQALKDRVAKSSRSTNMDAVIAYYDIIERQKMKISSMLVAIQDALPQDDFHLKNLVSIAEDLTSSHASWYRLQEELGIKEAISAIREREVSI